MRRRNDKNALIANLVLFGVIGVVVVFAYFVTRVRRRKRMEAFQRIAEELGLEFAPEVGDAYIAGLDRFELFSKGRAKKVANLLHGTSHDRSLAIFDYRYTIGHGKQTRTLHTTVLKIQFDGPELPHFWLRAESVWDKIAAKFGSHDIDFDTHPQFSRKYLLRGDDEAAVRAVFTPSVLEYFEAHPGLNTEVWGQTLMFYRLGKLVKPHEVSSFLADGLSLLPLFNRA